MSSVRGGRRAGGGGGGVIYQWCLGGNVSFVSYSTGVNLVYLNRVEVKGRHHLNFIDNQLIVSLDASLKKYYLHMLVDGANVGALQSLKAKLGTLSPNRRIL